MFLSNTIRDYVVAFDFLMTYRDFSNYPRYARKCPKLYGIDGIPDRRCGPQGLLVFDR